MEVLDRTPIYFLVQNFHGTLNLLLLVLDLPLFVINLPIDVVMFTHTKNGFPRTKVAYQCCRLASLHTKSTCPCTKFAFILFL